MHPFDIPLDQPLELPVHPVSGADRQDVAEGEVQAQEAEPEQQHVDGPEADPEGGQEPDDGGDDGEETHGRHLPARWPFDPVQLNGVLTRWCDGLEAFDDRAAGLHQVEEATAALGIVQGELIDRLVEGMPRKNGRPVSWTETPAGTLKLDWTGGYSSWDAEMVWIEALAEARRRAADPETGELSAEADRGAQAMLVVVKELLTSPAFRVTSLKNMGLDPDEYRATSPRRRTVKFVD
jgi:hypothetical protein